MRLINFFRQLFFIPHYILFLVSANKAVIVKDLLANNVQKSNFSTLTNALVQSRYFRNLFYFRINHFLTKILRLYAPQAETFIIDMNTKLGAGLHLAHPYATIINAAGVGENLYINHLVTVGEKDGKKPVIGNNVTIHANAIIIGDITIGDNAVIGAGAVVIKDVAASDVVVGNPAHAIKKRKC